MNSIIWIKKTKLIFFIILFIDLGLGCNFLYGGTPPVGKRKYSIDGSVYQPTMIHNSKENPSGAYLKDPNFFSGESMDFQKPTQPPINKGKKEISYKPTKLKFKKVGVKGEISNPRIHFENQRLNIKRSDEPLPSDFIEKTFDEKISPNF